MWFRPGVPPVACPVCSLKTEYRPAVAGLWWRTLAVALPVSFHAWCVVNREVGDNQHGLYCEACFNWSHHVCIGMSEVEYFNWASIDDGWVCPKWEREVFPFHNICVPHIRNSNSILTSVTFPWPAENSFSECKKSPAQNWWTQRPLWSENFDVILMLETWLFD